MNIVITSLATAASLVSFILAIHLLLKGSPRVKGEKRAVAIRYSLLCILCAALLMFSGSKYKESITTLRQSGDLGGYSPGINEIFYPIPYKDKPNLRMVHESPPILVTDLSWYGGSERIVEQRADGFKVETDAYATQWKWQAEGVANEAK